MLIVLLSQSHIPVLDSGGAPISISKNIEKVAKRKVAKQDILHTQKSKLKIFRREAREHGGRPSVKDTSKLLYNQVSEQDMCENPRLSL